MASERLTDAELAEIEAWIADRYSFGFVAERAAAYIRRMAEGIRAERTRNGELVAMLRRIQHADHVPSIPGGLEGGCFCPVCGTREDMGWDGHDADCELAALLEEAKE